MDFKTATDRLMKKGVRLEDVADALGVAHQTVRGYRLDPGASGYRRPPDNWRPKLAELLEKRGGDLQDLARELREEAGE